MTATVEEKYLLGCEEPIVYMGINRLGPQQDHQSSDSDKSRGSRMKSQRLQPSRFATAAIIGGGIAKLSLGRLNEIPGQSL